jgi:PAS domain S-box-containing protein
MSYSDNDGFLFGCTCWFFSREKKDMEFDILKEIADCIPGVIFFAKSRDGKFIYANREYERLFHVNREWLIGKTCYDLMPGDIADICCGHDQIVLTKGISKKFDEYYLVNGNQRSFSSIKFPLRDKSGTVYGVAGISIDVTERKRKEKELTEANARLEALVNAIPDIVIFKDVECRHLLVNKAAEKIMGISREEAAGKTNEEVLSLEAATICRGSDEKALASLGPVHAEESVVTETGETIHLDTIKNSIRDEQGKLMGLVTVSRDITERKQAEQRIKIFADLMDQSNDGILVVDFATGRFSMVNDKICRDLQYTREELLSMRPEDISSKPAGFFDRHFRELPEIGTFLAEDYHRRKDGSAFPVEVNVKYTEVDNRGFAVAVVRDISERRHLEKELQKAQKLESIGLLAGGIAHDFNNILTAILGNIELAKMFLPRENKSFERLATAEQAAIRARGITQQLLTFSRGGAPIKKTASVPKLIRDSVGFALRGANVDGEFSFPADLWRIEVDENQMQQVVNNLVINACQAMPEGGSLTVSARNEIIRTDTPLDLKEGKYVRIDFTDQGIGIPEEHLGMIFDPYFTTKDSGSGLGLPISFSVIKRHGGTITVRSAPGRGSTFSLFLPASEEMEISHEALERQENYLSHGRILVMDDDESVNAIVADLLQHLGYRVETVKDGNKALKVYDEARKTGDPFDAVITDLTVPGGMGGKETLRNLREIDPQAKVIVSSGYANDPIMSNYAEYGFQGVIPKPYRLTELGKTVREVIGKKQG